MSQPKQFQNIICKPITDFDNLVQELSDSEFYDNPDTRLNDLVDEAIEMLVYLKQSNLRLQSLMEAQGKFIHESSCKITTSSKIIIANILDTAILIPSTQPKEK